MKKFLEGLEKVGDKYRIRESITVTPDKVEKIPLTESKIMIEGKEYNTYKSYRFKIWDSDPTEKGFNANGRNYSKVISEVIKQNPTTMALADHPDEEGSVKDYCGIERNVRLDDDGWLSFEFIPVGEYGRTIEEIIEKGGFIEVSSSVLGELDENGYVKSPITLERLGDWVENCSCRLRQYSDKIEVATDNEGVQLYTQEEGCMEESTDKSKLTISNSENLEKGDNKMADKLVETSMKMNINSMVKDADKMENLYEKKDSLNVALSYANELTDKTLAEEIQGKVKSVEDELKVLSEKGMKTDELSDSVKELTETKESLEKEIASLKENNEKLDGQYKTLTEMYEEKQYKASEDELLKNRKLAKEVCTLKLESRNKDSQIQKLLRENKLLKRKMEESEAFANTQVSAEEYATLQEKVENLESKNEYLKKSLHEAKQSLSKMRLSESNQTSRFNKVRDMLNTKEPKQRVLESKSINSNKEEVVDDSEDIKMEKMLNK